MTGKIIFPPQNLIDQLTKWSYQDNGQGWEQIKGKEDRETSREKGKYLVYFKISILLGKVLEYPMRARGSRQC